MLRFQLFKVGVNDGIRTRDNWNHNPGLYQLSYIHHYTLGSTYQATKMVRLTGFEPVTIRLEGGCSIQLSYRRITMIKAIKRYFADLKEMFENIFKWSEQ